MVNLSFTYEDFNELFGVDINNLVMSRMSDITDQYEKLRDRGDHSSAELMRREGLMLANSYEAGESLFFAQVYYQ